MKALRIPRNEYDPPKEYWNVVEPNFREPTKISGFSIKLLTHMTTMNAPSINGIKGIKCAVKQGKNKPGSEYEFWILFKCSNPTLVDYNQYKEITKFELTFEVGAKIGDCRDAINGCVDSNHSSMSDFDVYGISPDDCLTPDTPLSAQLEQMPNDELNLTFLINCPKSNFKIPFISLQFIIEFS